MDLDKEIMRRLKVEVAALESAIAKKDRELNQTEDEHKLLISAVMKFGTMVAPGTMVMSVPTNGIGASGCYDVTISNHPERNESSIRVRRT